MSFNEKPQSFSQDNSWLTIEVHVKPNQTELLQGLDRWLELNLISEAQVKKICRESLSCALPEVKVVEDNSSIQSAITEIPSENLVSATTKPNIISQLWYSFLDELSIRWLLFLGIFLVVISSGVLAASQWNNFPQFGQYLILLIYTIVFWFCGFWAYRQDNLRLTAQTLKNIAILLVPINFWAISQFNLGTNLLEWLTIAIAFVTLTTIIYLQSRLSEYKKSKLVLVLFLLLSYLHLGWHLPLFSTVTIYGGIIAIAWFHYKFLLPKKKYPAVNLLFLFAAWSLLLARGLISNIDTESFTNYNLAITLFGWLLATVYLTIDRKNQNLAPTDNQEELERLTNTFLGKVFQIISMILLTQTWLSSIYSGIFQSELFFWQTLIINLLIIHLFSQRLTLYWLKLDLTAIFFVGLQTLYVSKELIPDNFRNEALNFAVNVSNTEYFPESVFGVTLFPYVILFVFVATWLYRRQKPQLALYAEYLTLLLGIGLTCLSLSNPSWRSLNLLFSTLTLAYVARIRQPMRINLIYVTHVLGLVTINNAINVIFPNLSQLVWGSILTALAVIELGICILKQTHINFRTCGSRTAGIGLIFRKSCWYFGLLLGAISYVCFLSQIETNFSPIVFRWGLVWLCIPAMLTVVAKYTRKIKQRRLATLLSCTTLITAQLLVFGQPETRIISLIVATGLMLVNAYCLRRTMITVIHIGFGLALIPAVLYGYITNWDWLIVGAVTILGLYQFRQYLQYTLHTPKLSYISQRNDFGILGVGIEEKNFKLIGKYIQATDYWAIALIVIEIVLLSVMYLEMNQLKAYPQYLLTTILVTIGIIWRYRKEPNNFVLYALVWLIELLIGGLVIGNGGNRLALAVANIILGILSLGLIRWQTKSLAIPREERRDLSWRSLNFAYIPLIYATLAILWRLSYFNSYTGLLTITAAIILISINLDDTQTNITSKYLGFTGISFGIYELVIYQMQRSSGGSIADGITILALVAAAIAFTYRIGAWWYRDQTTIAYLSLSQFILIAHIHWAISSILKILAASIAIESTAPRLTLISIATSFCLGGYALIQGRDSRSNQELNQHTPPTPPSSLTISSIKSENHILSDWWVYVGLVEIAATLVYSRLIITKLSLFDPWRVILTCIVALAIYQIPWQNFGWRATPWRHTALIIPVLMALVTAEDISYLSLFCTALFYVRIAYYQKNLRWSYVSLGFINWGILRLVWQYNTDSIWLAGIIGLSILYIAQFDSYLQSSRQQRHYVRLLGTSIICTSALFHQHIGIVPSIISLIFIAIGLGFKIRAFLFTGTVTIILTVIYQLVILVLTYSFLKWIVGLLVGICSIVIAAGFEKQRKHLTNQLQAKTKQLKNWE